MTIPAKSLSSTSAVARATSGRGALDVVRKRVGDLTGDEIARWTALQESLPEFESPYFRPEFARLVGETRGDVEVGVLAADGACVGFFPYQVGNGRVAAPVGQPVSDYQGVVVSPDVAWTGEELLRACDLKAFAFDHLLASQTPLAEGALSRAESPIVDLAEGYEAYRAVKNPESDVLRRGEQMKRRLGRRGEVSFTWRADSAVAETIHGWKRSRYVETGAFDPFATAWTSELIRRCLVRSDEAFQGCIAALLVDGRPVAANVCLRSGGVLHSWIPAYDPEFAKESPGHVLFHETLVAADAIGMRRLDLGKGEEQYKTRLMTGAVPLVEGAVDRRAARQWVRRGWYGLRDAVRSSPRWRKPLDWYRRLKRSIR